MRQRGHTCGGMQRVNSERAARSAFLRNLVIALWFFGWISAPDSEAVISISAVGGYGFVKIGLRLLLFSVVAYLLWSDRTLGKKRSQLILALPAVYVGVNLATIPLSQELFYSGYRLFEFALIWLSALVFLGGETSPKYVQQRIRSLFVIVTSICLGLIVLYWVSPEWGGKAGGFYEGTDDLYYRLGGSFLRVDLVASLGGSALLFWVFCKDRAGSSLINLAGIVVGLAIIALGHSRTAIIVLMVLFVASAFGSKTRETGLLVIIILAACAVLYQDQLQEFVMRGRDIAEMSTFNGRTDLWSAVLAVNDFWSLITGNGYLMNSPDGLRFYVPAFGRYMDSPHSGYFSVLLGSGVVGLVLVLFMSSTVIINIHKTDTLDATYARAVFFVAIFMYAMTVMDYGIWGVTSPSTLIFAIIYAASFKSGSKVRTELVRVAS